MTEDPVRVVQLSCGHTGVYQDPRFHTYGVVDINVQCPTCNVWELVCCTENVPLIKCSHHPDNAPKYLEEK